MAEARYIESDDGLKAVIDHLQRNTPLKRLNFTEAHAVFTNLSQLGYRIQKPAEHPSGLATTEEAITRVTDKLHMLAKAK